MRLRFPIVLGLLAACSTSDPMPPAQDDADSGVAHELPMYALEAATLRQLAPTEIALGQDLEVFGEGFLPAELAQTTLILDGEYDAEGEYEEFHGEFPLTIVNPSIARMDFESLIFSPVAGRVGVFSGTAVVKTRALALATNAEVGSERTSAPLDVEIAVAPSIAVTSLHSVDQDGCAPVTKATNASANLALELRALGFGQGSEDDPITIRIGFQSPGLAVQFVKPDVYQSWPLDAHPGLRDSVTVDAQAGDTMMTFSVDAGDTLELDPTWRQTALHVQPPVNVGSETHSEVLLGRLAAGPVEGGPGPSVATMIVEAERNGVTTRRTVSFEIWNQWEVRPYNGNQRVMERFPAEIPAGQCGSCVAGGDIGRDISYTEGESTSRTRSISMRWDVSTSNSVGASIGTGPFIPIQIAANAQTTWSSTFGMDVNTSVTSEMHHSLSVNAHVLPTFYGLCYRQLTRYEREVDVVFHNACGTSAVVGQAVLTDWGWGFDVATGTSCPPTTNLPPAENFE